MNSDNPLVIYCEDDRKYRVYCEICDKLCIERYYKNHLKSRTDTNNIRKIETSYFFYFYIQSDRMKQRSQYQLKITLIVYMF